MSADSPPAPLLYCRALYDFTSTDSSALSFRRGDVIEVYNQLESGWWDGVCGGIARGWFPSNYVEVISGSLGVPMTERQASAVSEVTNPASISSNEERGMYASYGSGGGGEGNDMSVRRGEGYFGDYETDTNRSEVTLSQPVRSQMMDARHEELTNSYWIQHSTPEGKIFYFNPRTRVSSWDIPPGAEVVMDPASIANLQVMGSSDSQLSRDGVESDSRPISSPEEGAASIPEEILPPLWGKKRNVHGRAYYYHMITDETLWSLKDVDPETGYYYGTKKSIARASIMSTALADNTASMLGRASSKRRTSLALEDEKRPGTGSSVVASTWSDLAQRIVLAIHQLNHSARHGHKSNYIAQSAAIVDTIRRTLVASGTVERDAPVVKSHSLLAAHHYHVMSSIARLVISAKQAARVWPPPDAVIQMQSDAADVLLAVRHFVNVAQDLGITVQPVEMDVSGDWASADHLYDDDEEGPVHSDLMTQLDIFYHEATEAHVTLMRFLQRTLSGNVAMTYGNGVTPGSAFGYARSGSLNDVSVLNAHQMISMSKEILTVTSKFLELVEEFQRAGFTSVIVSPTMASPGGSIKHFWDSRQAVFDAVAGLVISAQNASDPFAVADSITAIEEVMVATQTLDSAIRSLLIAVKIMVEERDESELAALEKDVDRFAQPKLIEPITGPVDLATSDGHLKAPGYKHTGSDVPLIMRRALSLSHLGGDSGDKGDGKATIAMPEYKAIDEMDQNDDAASIGQQSFRGRMGSQPIYATSRDDTVDSPSEFYAASRISQSETTSVYSGVETTIARDEEDAPATYPIPADLVSAVAPWEDPSISGQRKPPKSGGATDTSGRRKIQKILGEVDDGAFRAPVTDDRPWYLGPDYRENDIIYNMENSIKGGTLSALVARLTSHDTLGIMTSYGMLTLFIEAKFNNTFLLTYRSFCTTKDLFELLFKRFLINPPVGLELDELREWQDRKQAIIRLRVFNILRIWLENFYYEEEDALTLDRLAEFASKVMMEYMENAAKSVLRLIEKRRRSTDSSLKKMVLTLEKPAPPPVFPKNLSKLRFLDIDPLELARQLTIMESQLFQKIRPVECLNKSWSEKDESRGANIKSMIQLSNNLTGWVVNTILDEKEVRKRCVIIKHCVSVAEKCRSLHNFNTLMAIYAGLSSTPIHRLKRTWEDLPGKTLQSIESLKKLMSSTKNFAEYRASLHSVNPPRVPFLGVYLTDLTFIDDGNSDYIRDQPNLINFGKRAKAADVIMEIQLNQATPYNLTSVPEIQAYLRRELAHVRDIHDLYDMSVNMEPREKDSEKIARLLHESGFL